MKFRGMKFLVLLALPTVVYGCDPSPAKRLGLEAGRLQLEHFDVPAVYRSEHAANGAIDPYTEFVELRNGFALFLSAVSRSDIDMGYSKDRSAQKTARELAGASINLPPNVRRHASKAYTNINADWVEVRYNAAPPRNFTYLIKSRANVICSAFHIYFIEQPELSATKSFGNTEVSGGRCALTTQADEKSLKSELFRIVNALKVVD